MFYLLIILMMWNIVCVLGAGPALRLGKQAYSPGPQKFKSLTFFLLSNPSH
jgi:hypothetical protein